MAWNYSMHGKDGLYFRKKNCFYWSMKLLFICLFLFVGLISLRQILTETTLALRLGLIS